MLQSHVLGVVHLVRILGSYLSYCIKRECIWDQMVGCDRFVQGATCGQTLVAIYRYIHMVIWTLGRFLLQSGKMLVCTRDAQAKYIRTLKEHPRKGFGILNLSAYQSY